MNFSCRSCTWQLPAADAGGQRETAVDLYEILIRYVDMSEKIKFKICVKNCSFTSLLKISGDLEGHDLQDHTWNLKFT